MMRPDCQTHPLSSTGSKNTTHGNESISLEGYPANNQDNRFLKYHFRSECETKAYKRNALEDARLEEYVQALHKEKTIVDKNFQTRSNSLRMKSARMLGRRCRMQTTNLRGAKDTGAKMEIKTPVTNTWRTEVTPFRQRPLSSPIFMSKPCYISQGVSMRTAPCRKSRDKPCQTCKHMKRVMSEYRSAVPEVANILPNHSINGNSEPEIFNFTDRQAKTFMNILETEYCAELPEVVNAIQSKYVYKSEPDRNRTQKPETAKQTIYDRIRRFCLEQDKFNERFPLLEKVKKGQDVIRSPGALANMSHRSRFGNRIAS